MSERRIAKRYADALFLKASQDNLRDEIAADMSSFQFLVKESRDLEVFIKSPVISTAHKAAAFNKIFSSFQTLSKGMFNLVLEKKREEVLPAIAQAYLEAFNRSMGRVHASVTAASELKDDALKQISAYIKQQTGAREVILDTEENPAIIGGLVIRFEDKIYDTSIQSQIKKLKKEFNIA
jgi:F-type H+-transporting ATPase subunit delta